MKKAVLFALATGAGLCQFGCDGWWNTAHTVVYHAMDVSQWLKIFGLI